MLSCGPLKLGAVDLWWGVPSTAPPQSWRVGTQHGGPPEPLIGSGTNPGSLLLLGGEMRPKVGLPSYGGGYVVGVEGKGHSWMGGVHIFFGGVKQLPQSHPWGTL